MLGGAREHVGRQDVDQRLVGVERGLVGRGDLGRRLRFQPGLDEHRVRAAVESLVAEVADVGDVLDVQHLDAVVDQHPPDEVGQDVAAQVADVRIAVDGRSAGVHPDPPGHERLDWFDRPGEGVAQAQGHVPAILAAARRDDPRSPARDLRTAP